MEITPKRLDKIDPSEQHWHKLHGLDWRNKNNMTLCKSYAVALPTIGTLLMGKMKTARSIFAQYLLQHMRQLPEHETEVKGKWQQAKIPESLLKPAQEKWIKPNIKRAR